MGFQDRLQDERRLGDLVRVAEEAVGKLPHLLVGEHLIDYQGSSCPRRVSLLGDGRAMSKVVS